MNDTLIFVYNANSGKANTLLDVYHKMVSPETYKCNLCKLTHGVFTEHKQWKRFRKNTAIEMEFLHANEFAQEYKSKFGYTFKFPIVLMRTNDDLEVFITPKELNEIQELEALIKLITRRL
ncbi:GTPase [Ascidiimonas sp. W6]|uniref:GTPase n=1 Tax=Ascidiimonas meishanensis TaxID=3128903 RepID=UPI0030ED04B1